MQSIYSNNSRHFGSKEFFAPHLNVLNALNIQDKFHDHILKDNPLSTIS